jgi:hypothetical protein
MINLQQTYDSYLNEINIILHNLDDYNYESLENKIYNINFFLTKYHIYFKENDIDTTELKNKVNLLDSYYDNKFQNDQKKHIKKLTFINFTLLIIGIIISYFNSSIKNLGPDTLIKSKNAEYYLIIFIVFIMIVCYALFTFKII